MRHDSRARGAWAVMVRGSWAPAAGWGALVAGILGLLTLTAGEQVPGGLIAAASNGLVVAFLVGGVTAAGALAGDDSHRSPVAPVNPWSVAALPAVAAAGSVGVLRALALVLEVDGPWSSEADTGLDVAARGLVVFAVVGLVGQSAVRRR